MAPFRLYLFESSSLALILTDNLVCNNEAQARLNPSAEHPTPSQDPPTLRISDIFQLSSLLDSQRLG